MLPALDLLAPRVTAIPPGPAPPAVPAPASAQYSADTNRGVIDTSAPPSNRHGGLGPPSTPLSSHVKGMDADLRRHDERGRRRVNDNADWYNMRRAKMVCSPKRQRDVHRTPGRATTPVHSNITPRYIIPMIYLTPQVPRDSIPSYRSNRWPRSP
jgi:hypothetical protein